MATLIRTHLVIAEDEVEGGGVLEELDDDGRLGERAGADARRRDLGEADVPLVGEQHVGPARN